MIVARVAAFLLLLAGTLYALHRQVYVPFRCASAVSAGTEALTAAERRGTAERTRVARDVRNRLHGCERVPPPLQMRTLYALAEAATALGEHRVAVAYYERALAVDRRPELFFALGIAHLNALDRGAAIENLTRACAFDPARLAEIPYEDVRAETAARLRATYGAAWPN
ncbi:MAG TPA: tetratricopeptide repeat protein [Thermoanaerobaculia bacterium]